MQAGGCAVAVKCKVECLICACFVGCSTHCNGSWADARINIKLNSTGGNRVAVAEIINLSRRIRGWDKSSRADARVQYAACTVCFKIFADCVSKDWIFWSSTVAKAFKVESSARQSICTCTKTWSNRDSAAVSTNQRKWKRNFTVVDCSVSVSSRACRSIRKPIIVKRKCGEFVWSTRAARVSFGKQLIICIFTESKRTDCTFRHCEWVYTKYNISTGFTRECTCAGCTVKWINSRTAWVGYAVKYSVAYGVIHFYAVTGIKVECCIAEEISCTVGIGFISCTARARAE